MKNLYLKKPTYEELYFRKEMLEDPNTMNYNAGYDVSFEGYHYDTGCIDFPESKWGSWLEEKQQDGSSFYAYVNRLEDNTPVGNVNFHLNKTDNIYDIGVVIINEYRGLGYGKEALKLLCEMAFFTYGIERLRDTIPKTRTNALKVFESIGFQKTGEFITKKFKKDEIVYIMELTKNSYLEK